MKILKNSIPVMLILGLLWFPGVFCSPEVALGDEVVIVVVEFGLQLEKEGKEFLLS